MSANFLFQPAGKIWKLLELYFARYSGGQMKHYHMNNIVCCERDLGSLPVGWNSLETAGGIFC